MKFLPARLSSKVAVLTALAVAAAGAAGCSAGAAAGPTALPPEKPVVTVCDFVSIDSAGLYIANLPQFGYFTKMGLTVKIIPEFAGEQAVGDIQSGKCDIAAADPVTFVDSAVANVPLEIVAEGSTLATGAVALMVPPRSKITTLSGLAGHTIGTTQGVDVITLLLDVLLAGNGLQTGDGPGQVSFTTPKNFNIPTAAPALLANQVDASPLPDPFITADEEKYGLRELADMNQGANEDLPMLNFAVMKSWAQKYPNTLHDFLAGLEEGQNEADISRAAVQAGLVSVPALGVTAAQAALVAEPNFPTSLNEVALQRIPDGMLRFGLLKQPFNISSIIYQPPAS